MTFSSQTQFSCFPDFTILDRTKNWKTLAKRYAINCEDHCPLIGDNFPATFANQIVSFPSC